MLLGVPNDFAPASKAYPLLIVTATADGNASSIATCYQYLDDALAKGFRRHGGRWRFGKPTAGDPPSYRWALVTAGRDALEKESLRAFGRGHHLYKPHFYKPHLQAALSWFLEEQRKK